MTGPERELITASEIAALAGVSQAAVSNWRRRHAATFPVPVLEGLFDAGAVRAWLQTHRPGTGPQPQDRARGLGWDLASAVRGELDPATTLGLAASLVTLLHLDGDADADAEELGATAARVEQRAGLPAEVLTLPLQTAGRLRPATFKILVERVREAVTNRPPVEVFEDLLESLSSSPMVQEHYTPPVLVDFLSSLTPPQARAVLDPACGLGSLLVRAGGQLSARRLGGYEGSGTAWALCVQRLALHGLPTVDLHRGDFFTADPVEVDLVLANPPLAIRWPDGSPAAARLARYGGAGPNDGDFAWLFAARDALASTGTAVVITSNRATFGGGSTRTLRHELLRSGSVVAVFALPRGLFPSANIPVTAWVLQPPSSTPGDVLLVNAQPAGPRAPIADLLRAAASTYQQWRAAPGEYRATSGMSAVVPLLELLAGDAELTPARWTEVPADPDTALQAAESAMGHLASAAAALVGVHTPDLDLAVGPAARLVSLHDLEAEGVLQVLRARHINRDQVHDTGAHPYVTGLTPEGPRIVGYLHDLPERAVLTRPGDVLLFTLGQVRAHVDPIGGHVLGQGVWCIRPLTDDPAVAPDLLALLLESPRIGEQTVGTTVQRLRHPKDVTIPRIPATTAGPLVTAAQQLAQVRRSSQQLTQSTEEASRTLAEAIDAGITPAPARKGRR